MAQRADILLVFFLGTVLSGQRGNKLQLKLRFDIDTDSNLHFATFIKHRKLYLRKFSVCNEEHLSTNFISQIIITV